MKGGRHKGLLGNTALALLLAGASLNTCAQTSSDSTGSEATWVEAGDTSAARIRYRAESKPLSWRSVGIPTALVGFGTLSFTSDWARDINLFGRRFTSGGGNDPNERTNIDDHTMYLPAVAFAGLQIGGVRGKNNVVDATVMYAISNAIAYYGVVNPLKKFTATRRPDSSDVRSFPSGHTASAFVAAEFLRQEYKDVSPWIGAAGYGCAVLTGYLRMYNNRHWFSDVVAGAGVGILSTRVTYWLYPKVRRLTRPKTPGNTMIVPTYMNGSIGFSAMQRF